MNRYTLSIIIILIILLSGCSQSSDNLNEDNSTDEIKNGEEKDNDQDNETNNNNENTEEVDGKGEKENKESEKQSEPLYEVDDTWSIVPLDNADEKILLLTIDDAPDKYGVEMAHTLKKLDVPAIFFVNGHFLTTPEKEDELREIHDMGFMIGNHTYNHPFLPDLAEEKQSKEIIELNDLVEEIIAERPKFFRAPNGANTDHTKQVAEEENMTLMNWSYGYDWEEEYQTKEAITDIMVNTELLTAGSNLLMHDREWTAEALEDIVNGLREQGYEFVDPKLIKTD